MDINNVKKFLLAGTALVAVAAFSSPAQADTATLGGATTWASAGTGASAVDDGTDAQTGDNVLLQTFALTVTNNQTANDTSGLNTFVIGSIDNDQAGAGAVNVTQAAGGTAADLTVTIATVTNTGTGASTMAIANNDTANRNVAVTDSALLTLGGALTLTNNETSAAKTVALTVGGASAITGTTTITAGTFLGADTTLTLNGATNANGNITLNDGGTTNATGLAYLTINGAAATLNVAGNSAHEGTLTLGSTALTGSVGSGSSLLAVNATGSGASSISSTTDATTVTKTGTGTFTQTGALTATSLNINSASTVVLGNAAHAVTTTTFGAAGTLTQNGTLTGDINFAGFDAAAVTVADTKNITGNVDSTSSNGGVLTLSGTSTVSGTVGATNNLVNIVAGANTKTASFTSAVKSDALHVSGTGTVALNSTGTNIITTTTYSAAGAITLAGNLSGDVDFAGFDAAALTIADAKNITGTVNSSSSNGGVLTLSGTTTVSGAVGATNNLVDIIAGANTKTASFTGAVKSDALHVSGTGTVALNSTGTNTITDVVYGAAGAITLAGNLSGDVDFAGFNAAALTIADAKNITGDVDSTGSNGGVLTFSGSTTVSGDVGATNNLVSIVADGASGKTVNFTSAVNTDAMSVGAGRVNLNVVGTNIVTALGFTDDGSVHLADGGTITGAVDTGTAGEGTFVFDGDGTVSSTLGATNALKALTVSGSGKTGTVTGNLVAANTTTVSGNTLDTAGTFGMGATQTLNATILGAATNGSVTAGGAATIANGANLVISIDSSYHAAAGFSHTYTFVDGTGGVGVGTVDLSGPSLWTFTQTGTAGARSDLTVTATRNALSDLDTTTNSTVGDSLDTIGFASGDAVLTQINTDIADATTVAEINNILATLTPTVDGGAQVSALQVGAEVQNITDTRMASLRSGEGLSGMAAGASNNGVSVWVQGYGQHSEQDTHDNVAGYDSDTWGAAIGADTTNLLDNGVVGFVLNYGSANVDSNNANTTNTDVDNYGLGLYGTVGLGKYVFVNGQVGYAYNNIDSVRHNVNGPGSGVNANGSTHSDQYMAKVALGSDYPVDYGTVLTPSVSAAYTYLNTQGYQETGAGANLTVQDTDVNALDLGVDLKASWKLKNADGSLMKPMVHAGYSYDVIGDEIETTASFAAGPSFVTTGADPDQNTFRTGAGLTYMTTANWDMTANYDYTFRQDYSAHSGILRVTSHF